MAPRRKAAAAFASDDSDEVCCLDDIPEQPQKKKRKPRAKSGKVQAEKRTGQDGRTVTYRAAPSQRVLEKIGYAKPGSPHRMYMLERKAVAAPGAPDGPCEEFTILGVTGNVYKVTISRQPSCSCPDGVKRGLCKHHMYVMLRVLRRDEKDPLVWQKALLTKEVEELIGGRAAVDKSVLAQDAVRQRYLQSTASAQAPAAADSRRRAVDGDCPICCSEMEAESNAPQEQLSWCDTCGNNVHIDCFKRWADTKKKDGTPLTCIYCRAPWVDGSMPGGREGSGDGQYLNLGGAAEKPSLEELYGARAAAMMKEPHLMLHACTQRQLHELAAAIGQHAY